ncbi:sensor histidine kinase [Pseudooceanicola sediminis]|nr:HAMP domain-containing sensor histidine kinase [Pseudooceanicola sediminis]
MPPHLPSASGGVPPPSSTVDEVEELLYILSHDLRTGFRAILTIPDFIEEDLSGLPEPQKSMLAEHLEMLRVQARRSDRMLLDLRDYSRIGRLASPVGVHTLADILARCAETAPLPDGFVLHVSGTATLSGPLNELVMLFRALLSNCVKHHDATSGRIDISTSQKGTMTRIIVADDGPGIPNRFRKDVFEMLRTLRSRDECEGSGIGLSLARKIVTALGGTIEVLDSGDSRGTAIALTVPTPPPTEQSPT